MIIRDKASRALLVAAFAFTFVSGSSAQNAPQPAAGAHGTSPQVATEMPVMQAQHPTSKPEQQKHRGMQGMKMSGNQKNMGPTPVTFIQQIERHTTSGTSAEPDSTPTPMLMMTKGNWMLMLHGVAFVSALQQSGPRGSDKVFSTNWIMPMVQRKLGPGTLALRTMLSLEPATVTHRYYPELFQQGETEYGKPIVDGQHPHDLFMEIGALYDLNVGRNSLLTVYFAPVGDPAMGPTAYPHRASASENPMAALGHHLEDSTHISDDVITVGFTHKIVRVEVSGFHGREPDEYRWDIDQGKMDSWSTRLTLQPGKNWSAQYSFAHLTRPEALHPTEDLQRMTASLMYNRPLEHGNWASTLAWGRNHSLETGLNWNGYLAESTLQFAQRNYLWGRVENVDRTSELLLRNQFELPNFQETVIGRVQAYTAGYERDYRWIPHLAAGIGAQFTLYSTPEQLQALYGNHPGGGLVFLRLRPSGD